MTRHRRSESGLFLESEVTNDKQRDVCLGYTRSPAELAIFRPLKPSLDPQGILNPGKIFD